MLFRVLLVSIVAAALTAPALAAGEYALDPAHTQAQFTVTHLAVSRVHGQIPLVNGACQIGADDLPANCTATFDLRAVDSHDENRDKSLRNDIFDVDHYPTMTFVEKSVQGTPQSFTMNGDLTMHGVTRPVTVQCQTTGSGTFGAQNKRHYGYTGHVQIDRRDWNMNFARMLNNQLFAGNEVTIDLEVDAVQKS